MVRCKRVVTTCRDSSVIRCQSCVFRYDVVYVDRCSEYPTGVTVAAAAAAADDDDDDSDSSNDGRAALLTC